MIQECQDFRNTKAGFEGSFCSASYIGTKAAQCSLLLLSRSPWGKPTKSITFISQMDHIGSGGLFSKSVAWRAGLWACAHSPCHTDVILWSLPAPTLSMGVNCEFSLKASRSTSAKPAILKTAHFEILDQLCPLSRPWFCHLYSGRVPSEVGWGSRSFPATCF